MKIIISKYLCLIVIIVSLLFAGCHKKSHPGSSKNTTVVKKPVKIKTPVPKIISVNDAIAGRTADGRLYYDLEGKRYWKNKKDGKYYLYNKSMYGNPDFSGQ